MSVIRADVAELGFLLVVVINVVIQDAVEVHRNGVTVLSGAHKVGTCAGVGGCDDKGHVPRQSCCRP